MEVRATTDPPLQTGADTICVGLVEGEEVAHDVADGALGALVEYGEARTAPRKVAVAHAEGARWLLVGLGPRDKLDAEGARVAAAVAEARARELRAQALCWELLHHVDDAFAAGLVEGTLLAAYRFDRFKSNPDAEDGAPDRLGSLAISAHHDVAAALNAARDLQNTPANELTPTRLGERARELAGTVEGLTAEVDGREAIVARGMGAFAAVASGSDEEPALITLRYEGAAAAEPVLGLVGKAVTFDTGGISIKPAGKM